MISGNYQRAAAGQLQKPILQLFDENWSIFAGSFCLSGVHSGWRQIHCDQLYDYQAEMLH